MNEQTTLPAEKTLEPPKYHPFLGCPKCQQLTVIVYKDVIKSWKYQLNGKWLTKSHLGERMKCGSCDWESLK